MLGASGGLAGTQAGVHLAPALACRMLFGMQMQLREWGGGRGLAANARLSGWQAPGCWVPAERGGRRGNVEGECEGQPEQRGCPVLARGAAAVA